MMPAMLVGTVGVKAAPAKERQQRCVGARRRILKAEFWATASEGADALLALPKFHHSVEDVIYRFPSIGILSA